MIKIVDTATTNDDLGQPQSRACQITITDGVNTYLWNVGGLPLMGDLQPILDGREAELWAAASAAAIPVPSHITAKLETRQFLVDNPNAKLLIELPAADLLNQIQTRTAAQETLLLKTLAMAVRFLYEQERLND